MTSRNSGGPASSPADQFAPDAPAAAVEDGFRAKLAYPWMAKELVLAYACKREGDDLVDQMGVSKREDSKGPRVKFLLARRRRHGEPIRLDQPWQVQVYLLEESEETSALGHEQATASDALYFVGTSYLKYGPGRSGQNVALLFRRMFRERTGIDLFWRYSVDEPHMGVWRETLDAHFGAGFAVALSIFHGDFPEERQPALESHCQLILHKGDLPDPPRRESLAEAIDAAAAFFRAQKI